ncbi:MAG: TlpA family protein disulfide reductase [Magnetospirillum sp. WYHS-4]
MGRTVLAAVIASVIVAISPPVASAEASCSPDAVAYRGFKVTNPPKPVPDEPVAVVGEKLVTLPGYKGKGIVLNFWATWCPPCIKEMPSLSRLQDKLAAAKEKIEVVTVSQDRLGEPAVKKFFEGARISNLPMLLDPRTRLGQLLLVSGLPTTLFIDASGRERARWIGPAEWDSPQMINLVKACTRP